MFLDLTADQKRIINLAKDSTTVKAAFLLRTSPGSRRLATRQ